MKQYCLKFADETRAREELIDYIDFNQEVDGISVQCWITSSKDHALDVVGTIYKPTGETLTDAEGNEYPEMAPMDGFHVNLVTKSLPNELKDYVVIPETPSRVFAGISLHEGIAQ
jgi:hypothetical protein